MPVSQTAQNGGSMNKDFENELEDDLLPNYDFANMTGGVKGKYVDRYRSGTNIVLLDPDVADAFPTAESVNEALRMLLAIADRQTQRIPVE